MERLRRAWRSIPVSTKAFSTWLVSFAAVGTGLFLQVTNRQGGAVAYDILTQRTSPFGADLGIPGVLLSVFGYFLAPAAIGALAGVVYVATSAVSSRSIAKRMDQRMAQLEASRSIAPSTGPTTPGGSDPAGGS